MPCRRRGDIGLYISGTRQDYSQLPYRTKRGGRTRSGSERSPSLHSKNCRFNGIVAKNSLPLLTIPAVDGRKARRACPPRAMNIPATVAPVQVVEKSACQSANRNR